MQARAVSSAAFAFTASLRRLASPRRVVAAGTLVPPARPTRRPATTAPMASSPSSSGLVTDTFFLDDFAMRQWDDPNYGGTKIDFDKAAFVARVHDAHKSGESPLVDGYAPFCKHVFVRNFVPGTKVGAVEITPDNEHLLRSGYSARSDAELPVLTRWFPQEKMHVPDATWLDVILYSREQLELERAAVPSKQARPPLPDAPWGIISVKGQTVDYECPMTPITIMRNALGKEEGGSGVPIDRDAYAKSVEYHRRHAPLVKGDSPNGE